MSTKLVSELMQKEVATVKESDTLGAVIQIMNADNLTHILVTTRNMKVVGLISKNDLFKEIKKILKASNSSRYTELELESIKASDIMTSPILFLDPNDKAIEAFRIFLNNTFHALPVLDNGRVVGIVTHFDLLKAFSQKL